MAGPTSTGRQLTRTWSMIGQLQPFWRDSLARFGVDLALVPTGSAFAHELLREPGWRLRDCDETAVLLQKKDGWTDRRLDGWTAGQDSSRQQAAAPAADSLLADCFKRSPVP